jgi:hypothetical protein
MPGGRTGAGMSMPPDQYGYQQPLEYAGRLEAFGRPGVLTAVGIISIVVGALSVLGSLSGVVTGIMYLVMANVTFPSPQMMQPATMPAGAVVPAGNSAPARMAPGFGTAPIAQSQQRLAFPFHVAPGASELTIAEGSLSLAAAILLIVAGSLMLKDSPSSWKLHRIWALLKMPLIVASAFATYWTFTSMMNGMSPLMGANAPAGFGSMMGVVQAVLSALIALIYPVAVLIVLSTRTSKEWYEKLNLKSDARNPNQI